MTARNGRPERIAFRLLWAFFALLLLYLVWGLPYFPTQDGPSHLYNAWVMTAIGDPAYPLVTGAYGVDRKLFPNWAGQAILSTLIRVTSPAIAEKTLFSLLVLGIPAATLVLARTVGRGRGEGEPPWWSLLGFFFALNHPLHKGFENHGLGLIVYIFILAWWWRNRRPGWTVFRVAILNILLAAAYFCHIVPFLVSLLSVAALEIFSGHSRAVRIRFLAGLTPAGLLLVYYLFAFREPAAINWPGADELRMKTLYLLKSGMLMGFSRREGWYIALSLLLGLGVIRELTARPASPKENRLLPLLSAGLIVLYLVTPDQIGRGRYLNMRLALYPLFPLLAWLSPPKQPPLKIILIVLIALFNLVHWQESLAAHRTINRHYRRIVSLAGQIPEHSFVITARKFKRGHQQLRPLLHAVGYGIVGRDIVNLGNYEARLPYFPVRWNREVEFSWPVFHLSAAGNDYILTPLEKTAPRERYYRSLVTGGS